MRTRLLTITMLMATLLAGALPVAAHASSSQESIFQDDDHLIYGSTRTVQHTLGILQSLGVDRIRVTVKWSAIAPDPFSRTRPAHFRATDPAAYPAANWVPYDRIIELAEAHGIGVDFNVTDPGPLWAMAGGAPKQTEADHYAPSASEFAQFVFALGDRYSGTYVPPAPAVSGGGTSTSPLPTVPPVPVPGGLASSTRTASAGTADTPGSSGASGQPIPRVHYWSIWNEPNVDGWLSPQWGTVHGRTVPESPRLYREYVDVAFLALYDSGHRLGHDTILVGETAPEGYSHPTAYPEMEPMPFLRTLFCVDEHYHQLRGAAAGDVGCPTSGTRQAFVNANAGLFLASGWSHHPYYFYFPPSYISSNTGYVPLGNLSRLEGGLDRIFRLYGVKRQMPLYITEYGFQTNPPDPFQVVTPAEQAAYINQADYLVWRDPRVHSVAQFLLYDAPPPYAETFQTGLLYQNGSRKPAYAAYRLPVYAPFPSVRRGGRLRLWGQLRPARDRSVQKALVQWKGAHGGYRRIATVVVPASSPEGYFTASVRLPGSGSVRIAWQPPHGALLTSRSFTVTVRR